MREFTIEGVRVAVGAAGEPVGALGADTVLGHLCPNCGAADHGRPIVLEPAGKRGLSISRSRCGELEVTAICDSGARGPIGGLIGGPIGCLIGVDIESSARVGDREAAFDWVAKEALTKATGHGVRVDFRDIHLERDGAIVTVRRWPAELGLREPPLIRTFVVDDDIVGALAIL